MWMLLWHLTTSFIVQPHYAPTSLTAYSTPPYKIRWEKSLSAQKKEHKVTILAPSSSNLDAIVLLWDARDVTPSCQTAQLKTTHDGLLFLQSQHGRKISEQFVCVLPTGCQVSGPWDSADLDDLSELVQDLRLCSQGLNKLDRQSLKQSWDKSRHSKGHFIDRNSRCLLSAAASS